MVSLRAPRHDSGTPTNVVAHDNRGLHFDSHVREPRIRPIAFTVGRKSGLVGRSRNQCLECMGSLPIRETE